MKINYRPEIDGLRAISVCAIIIYHAKISILGQQIFKGGFVGVDIFFVISGYLITKLIVYEISQTNSFSLKLFYERRARRILPALLFVISISLFFGFFILLPDQFVDLSYSIISSIFFFSNIYFFIDGSNYGSSS